MLVRITVLPFLGSKITTIVHFPLRTALRLVPKNAQYLVPFVMLMRIVPADFLGIDIDTDAANFAALTFEPCLIAIG